MVKVGWFTTNPQVQAQIWRVLDLSGMTKSVRESLNFTKSGFVYLNGNLVQSIRETISLGEPFTLELRFPNGVTKSQEIMLVMTNRLITATPRQNTPTETNYEP